MINERRNTDEHSRTLRDILVILFKHRTKIGIVFFGVVAAATVLSFVLPPTYEAKSSVLVKLGREYLYEPEVGDKTPMMSFGQQSQEEILNSELEIITNRDLTERVISIIGVKRLYPDLIQPSWPFTAHIFALSEGVTPKDEAVIRFGKKLSVEVVKKSNVINVSFRHKDPRLAAQAVNLLVDYFKEKHLQVYSDPKSSFLEEQVALHRDKLETSESTLQTFKQTQAVYSLDEQRKLMLEQRVKLDTAYKDTQNSIKALQEKLRSLNGQARKIAEDGNTFAYSEQGKIITDAKTKLLDLQLRERQLVARYNEENRLVKQVRKEIQMTREFLDAQERDVTSKVRTGNLVYQEVEKERIKTEADLSAQKAVLASLGPQRARVGSTLKDLDRREKEFLDLKREAATNEKNYQHYLEKYEEARISDDMNRKKMANISIIQAAAVPTKPVSPKRTLNILFSIVFGGISAFGTAFLSEYLNHTFSTAQDVEQRLGLPVLTSVTDPRL